MSTFDLVWDQTGERQYETGVNQCALFPMENGNYSKGVAWSGITAVTESPSGAEPTDLYADNIKFLSILSNEEFGATIEAYMYPDAFAECDGSASIATGVFIGQQTRKKFGLVYKTILGNDVDLNDHGYKLHFIYNALAAPSEKTYNSVNDNPDAAILSWEISTTPVNVTGYKPTATVIIDSTKVEAQKLAKLEEIIYGKAHELVSEEPSDWSTNYTKYFTKEGNEFKAVAAGVAPSFEEGTYYTANVEARLPLPDEIATIMK